MTGLETIVEQILQEAHKEAEEIKAQAARNADSIIANAKKTVDKMNEETREKVTQAEKSGSFRAKSSSDLKKRQAILAAKQDIIKSMLDKAYDRLVDLPDDEYFQVVLKCLEKAAQPKSGDICFSEKDRCRLTPQTVKKIEQIAEDNGGSLKVSDVSCDIDGGFILIYGGIEENCSFRAMLDANRERLADRVNEILFVDNR